MRHSIPFSVPLAAAFLVAMALILGPTVADAQSTRSLNRSVKAGQEVEFQWLNFNDRTCKDNGYPSLIVERKPSLGRFRTVKRQFTQRSGPCKGRKFSVLLVYYVAGRNKGTDRTAFVIDGQNRLRIMLNMQVE